MAKEIYRDDKYHLVLKEEISPEIIKLFDETMWGQKGALYEHKNTEERLRNIADPTLLELRTDEDLVGCCVLVGRYLETLGYRVRTNFVRYLVSTMKYRGSGMMSKYAPIAMGKVEVNHDGPVVFIGVVEAFNQKSYNLVKAAGYNEVAKVKTIPFSRFFPKKKKLVEQVIRIEDKAMVKSLLDSQFNDFLLYHTENLFHKDQYYIKRNEEGEIVAGVQYFHAHWVVKSLPGFSGKIVTNILPYLPVLNKVFNPKNFNFLAFDYIYVKPGHIADLHDVMEHVLALTKKKTGMFWMDKKSNICQDVLKFDNLGLLYKSGAASDSMIMVRLEDFTQADEALFQTRPVFQTAFDFI